MRFPGKTARVAAKRVNFDDYDWAAWTAEGWWEVVVLMCEEAETRKGADMLKITLGLENPDGIGGRVMHFVPESYPPKVFELAEAMLPDMASSDDGGELTPTTLRFKRCAALIEEDKEYQRDDGAISWKATKLLSLQRAAETLGEDWRDKVFEDAPEGGSAEKDDDADLF